jgi:hypothetical protein
VFGVDISFLFYFIYLLLFFVVFFLVGDEGNLIQNIYQTLNHILNKKNNAVGLVLFKRVVEWITGVWTG